MLPRWSLTQAVSYSEPWESERASSSFLYPQLGQWWTPTIDWISVAEYVVAMATVATGWLPAVTHCFLGNADLVALRPKFPRKNYPLTSAFFGRGGGDRVGKRKANGRWYTRSRQRRGQTPPPALLLLRLLFEVVVRLPNGGGCHQWKVASKSVEGIISYCILIKLQRTLVLQLNANWSQSCSLCIGTHDVSFLHWSLLSLT